MTTKRIKLDVFSLIWIDLQISNSRSNGVMWVDYNDILDKDSMSEVLHSMMKAYPMLTSNLVREGNTFYFEYNEEISNEEINSRLFFTDESTDKLVDRLVMHEINLFEGPLYEVYIADHGDYFSIVVNGAHVIGDGVSIASFLSLLLYNYYLHKQNQETIFPEMRFEQLLSYVENLKYTRFRKIFTPKPFRILQGIFYYLKLRFRKVESLAFNIPIDREEKLLVWQYKFNETFHKVHATVKERYKVNSNHLMLATFSYAKMKYYDYDHIQVTYPVNVRNEYGLVVGNLLVPNSIKVKMKDDFESYLLKFKKQLNRERRKLGPYFVISLGRFINPTIEDVHDNMSHAKGANIRFSNVGRLPSANLLDIDPEIFDNIPISNYRIVATPLGAIAVHPFVTSIKNKYINEYYMSILHTHHTLKAIKGIIDIMEKTLEKYHETLSKKQ